MPTWDEMGVPMTRARNAAAVHMHTAGTADRCDPWRYTGERTRQGG